MSAAERPDWLPTDAELAEAQRINSEFEKRASYVSGLRKWADILEAHPQVPLPFYGTDSKSPVLINFGGEGTRDELAAARQAIGGQWEKTVDEAWLNLNGQLDGFYIQLYASRDAVCTRRVVGTEEREVEEEVRPAETRKVRKQVDVIEWDCHPILGGGDSRWSEHDWMRDPERRGEGLICRWCGVTEAEMDASNGRFDRCHSALGGESRG